MTESRGGGREGDMTEPRGGAGEGRSAAREVRARVRVTGQVQGVGFRPFVAREALREGLAGHVANTSQGVSIQVRGPAPAVERFLGVLRGSPPPSAEVESVEVAWEAPQEAPQEAPHGGVGGPGDPEAARAFRVLPSRPGGPGTARVAPDLATCDACLAELWDPTNRRHRHPFITCTSCGPRFTITRALPYDRAETTLDIFPLCPECAREYTDPATRRYHAEPIACLRCGPRLRLVDPAGRVLAREDAAVARARRVLAEGGVLVVQGLGGFHLCCDASDEQAVRRVRAVKRRPDRPLAVMCRDVETVRSCCHLDEDEAAALSSPVAPVLLLRRREAPGAAPAPLAPSVAPGLLDVGVLLPYTPLHHLLLAPGGGGEKTPAWLVATSANRAGAPMGITLREVLLDLGEGVDAVLCHDRAIWSRCDDSVARVHAGRLQVLRRSRGWVPRPVALPVAVEPILALGALLQVTVALAEGRRAVLSQHIGDVETVEGMDALEEAVRKLRGLTSIEPRVVTHDAHPDLPTTHLARQLAGEVVGGALSPADWRALLGDAGGRPLRRVAVQHHHAHFAAVLVEAGVQGEAQGLILDGTGWGPDGTIWGGELLVGTLARARRAGHLRPLPLPGGEAAIRRPARIAVAYLQVLVPGAQGAPLALWRRVAPEERAAISRMVTRGVNAVQTSSVGRLFDAVSALLGVRLDVTYEAQAAVELEHLARPVDLDRRRRARWREAGRSGVAREGGQWVLDPSPMLKALVEGLGAGAPPPELARGFHVALAEGMALICVRLRDEGAPARVALSGGAFANRLLLSDVSRALRAGGLVPLVPERFPVGDGGLALGQVAVAGVGGTLAW